MRLFIITPLLYLSIFINTHAMLPNKFKPLHHAALSCQIEKVELELRKASPNIKGPTGKTALHYALMTEKTNANKVRIIIKLLKDHGADINMQDLEGLTPLHQAALQEWPEMMRFLTYDMGADKTKVNHDNKTAQDLYEISQSKIKSTEFVDQKLKCLNRQSSDA